MMGLGQCPKGHPLFEDEVRRLGSSEVRKKRKEERRRRFKRRRETPPLRPNFLTSQLPNFPL
jgi:hypothetical protein